MIITFFFFASFRFVFFLLAATAVRTILLYLFFVAVVVVVYLLVLFAIHSMYFSLAFVRHSIEWTWTRPENMATLEFSFQEDALSPHMGFTAHKRTR